MGWDKTTGTPDVMKPEGEGPAKPFGNRPCNTPYRKRVRKAVIKVDEPLMREFDNMMQRHGVSSGRLEGALGLGVGRIKDMRKFNSAWEVVTVLRRALWLMGYDLRFKIVKVRRIDKSLIMTVAQKKAKDVEKITGRKGKWEARKMWAWLGMDKLEEEND